MPTIVLFTCLNLKSINFILISEEYYGNIKNMDIYLQNKGTEKYINAENALQFHDSIKRDSIRILCD